MHVGVLAFPGCFATEVFGLSDLFVMADLVGAATPGSPARFRTSVLGRTRTVTAAGGHGLRTEGWDRPVDVVVVPGFEVSGPAHLDDVLGGLRPEVGRLRDLARSGVPVASVCVGAFLLGAAGLLDGRRATTSWLFADQLRERHPDCTVEVDAMVVSDGPVTTTAAFSAVHDLALRFVRSAGGDALARRLARVTLVADNRSSQAPYVDESMLGRPGSGLVRDAQRWLVERLDQPYDLTALAAAFHVSTRTMLRRFADETGGTPLDHLQMARVRAAKRLLESPDHTVGEVMERVGYRDPASFRRLFRRHTGLSPGAYRAGFTRRGAPGCGPASGGGCSPG
jgi:transcriptional regulator GlxA family with amidase domain